MTPLTALSPIDGRYASKADSLRPYLSEFGLIKARVTVEIRWLQSLADNSAIGELAAFDDQTNAEVCLGGGVIESIDAPCGF